MNTINTTSMVHVAMDGQNPFASIQKTDSSVPKKQATQNITPNGSQVAQDLEQNLEKLKADTQELQKLTELVDGRKLQFNVNKELGSVIVKVVDSSTNQVLKEIPSEEIQNLKLRIRKAIGTIFDKMA